jgi:hypothetical protein
MLPMAKARGFKRLAPACALCFDGHSSEHAARLMQASTDSDRHTARPSFEDTEVLDV